MNENFTKLITLIAFMSCNFNLMADEIYQLGDIPEEIPGWDVIVEPDGSTLLFPQKMNQVQQTPLSEQSIEVEPEQFPATKPSMLDGFPDKIPGWDVIVEPDGSTLLFPQKINQVQQAPLSEQSIEVEPEQFPATKPSMLDGFPDKIPDWDVIVEPNGSILLFPQKMNQAQQAPLPEQSIEIEPEQFPATKPSILDDFPDKIPNWGVIIEPDGSRVLIPKGFIPMYDATDSIANDLSQQGHSMSDSEPCPGASINKHLDDRNSIWRLDNY